MHMNFNNFQKITVPLSNQPLRVSLSSLLYLLLQSSFQFHQSVPTTIPFNPFPPYLWKDSVFAGEKATTDERRLKMSFGAKLNRAVHRERRRKKRTLRAGDANQRRKTTKRHCLHRSWRRFFLFNPLAYCSSSQLLVRWKDSFWPDRRFCRCSFLESFCCLDVITGLLVFLHPRGAKKKQKNAMFVVLVFFSLRNELRIFLLIHVPFSFATRMA